MQKLPARRGALLVKRPKKKKPAADHSGCTFGSADFTIDVSISDEGSDGRRQMKRLRTDGHTIESVEAFENSVGTLKIEFRGRLCQPSDFGIGKYQIVEHPETGEPLIRMGRRDLSLKEFEDLVKERAGENVRVTYVPKRRRVNKR